MIRKALNKGSNILIVRIIISLLMCKQNMLKLIFRSSIDKEEELDQFLAVRRLKLSIHSFELVERYERS
jgi:hypothetical protein